MGNTFFPGDISDQQVAILKPNENISLRWLAILRLVVAVYFLGQLAFNLYQVYETFYLYLTNWALASCAFTYPILALGHCLNNDFTKIEEADGKAEKKNNKCFKKLWKPITALYEWSISVQLTVTLAFWCVEIPAMGMRGDFYSLTTISWFGLIYSHIAPVLFCYAEWRFSSIEVAWVRYPFYFLVSLAYLIMMVFS